VQLELELPLLEHPLLLFTDSAMIADALLLLHVMLVPCRLCSA
jgi:hypothetical protein